MKSKIETHQATQSIETTTQLDFIRLEDDLLVFRREVSSIIGRSSGKGLLKPSGNDAPNSENSGYINNAGRKQLLAGKELTKNNQKQLIWLTDDQIEGFRTRGYPAMEESIANDWKKAKPDLWVDWSQNTGRSVENLVRMDPCSHMLYDRNGEILPVALLFDYISGGFGNDRFDLKSLYEKLKDRSDVRIFRGDEKLRGEWPQEAAKNFDEAIFQIPYYNSTEDRNASLQFAWLPDAETYKKVFQDPKKSAGQRHQTVIFNDVFGTRYLDKYSSEYEQLAPEPATSAQNARKNKP